jgi:1-acyl-sn-glycerol-3-phosphate acyltransferase
MIRTGIVVVFYMVSIVLGSLVGIPVTFATGKIDFLYALAMKIARTGMRLGGIRVKVLGSEHVDPTKTYLFMSNHTSNVDPPIVIPAIPMRTSVLAKKEVFRIPVLGYVMRLAKLVPVDRKNRDAAVDSMHRAAEVLQQGISMTVFPEGTRSFDGQLLPFKKGPFYLALEAGVPVVPMTIAGTHAIMPKRRLAIHPGIATVTIHPPIDPKQFQDREALAEAVRARIASAL